MQEGDPLLHRLTAPRHRRVGWPVLALTIGLLAMALFGSILVFRPPSSHSVQKADDAVDIFSATQLEQGLFPFPFRFLIFSFFSFPPQ